MAEARVQPFTFSISTAFWFPVPTVAVRRCRAWTSSTLFAAGVKRIVRSGWEASTDAAMSCHASLSVQSRLPSPSAANSSLVPSAMPTPITMLFGCPNAAATSSNVSARSHTATWWICPLKLFVPLALLIAAFVVAL